MPAVSVYSHCDYTFYNGIRARPIVEWGRWKLADCGYQYVTDKSSKDCFGVAINMLKAVRHGWTQMQQLIILCVKCTTITTEAVRPHQ